MEIILTVLGIISLFMAKKWVTELFKTKGMKSFGNSIANTCYTAEIETEEWAKESIRDSVANSVKASSKASLKLAKVLSEEKVLTDAMDADAKKAYDDAKASQELSYQKIAKKYGY